jgi:uncharacterized ion transporter superfamily protein YfcC
MKTGRKMFWMNAMVASLFLIPGYLHLSRTTPLVFATCFLAASVWALFFEYSYHRWLQHNPGTYLAMKHNAHHASYQKPDEEEHVNFGGDWKLVVTLFVVNGLPIFLLDLFFHHTWLPGVMTAFVFYFIIMEDNPL